MLNTKSQVAQTTNWIVATIIIIVILLISLFLANGDLFERKIEFKDKQKDLVATKTIINYLNSDFENISAYILEENYSKLDTNLNPILERLWKDSKSVSWSFNLFIDNSKSPNHIIVFGLGEKPSYLINILFNIGNKKVKMIFAEETGWLNIQ